VCHVRTACFLNGCMGVSDIGKAYSGVDVASGGLVQRLEHRLDLAMIDWRSTSYARLSVTASVSSTDPNVRMEDVSSTSRMGKPNLNDLLYSYCCLPRHREARLSNTTPNHRTRMATCH